MKLKIHDKTKKRATVRSPTSLETETQSCFFQFSSSTAVLHVGLCGIQKENFSLIFLVVTHHAKLLCNLTFS